MGKSMLIKSVAFNKDDPGQLAMWDHSSQQGNFSGYVKHLIARDMEGSGNRPPPPPPKLNIPWAKK